ncbi:MAG: UDP-N-acetylglucosamine--LPS N-acetylglucosamine transferase [Planctomycetota bacterium]
MTRREVLAVASGGGHWVELMRLAPAFEGRDVAYVSVAQELAADVPGRTFYAVVDATRWDKVRLARCALKLVWIVLRERPRVVVSTGAAPGWFALAFARRLVGARTVWIDSIANAETLSLSGQRAGKVADLWLTQWPEVARPGGPEYAGSVL